jgi:hypothetical protein
VLIAAFAHGEFGRTYASSVVIGNKLVATAQGEVPEGDDPDDGLRSFILRVA